MKFLELLAKICAVIGGIIILSVAFVASYSVTARYFWGSPIMGDFELVGIGAGAAVAFFLPWCQIKQSNIIVDFFTQKLSPSSNAKLDRFGCLLMALMLGLLAWRTSLGLISARESQSGSMLLGFPDWISYSFLLIPLIITTIIAVVQFLSPKLPAHPESLTV